VIGRRFRGDLLREISELDGDQVDSSLQELVDRHLIDLEALYPEREYAFRHALTRDVAYASPLSEFRARTHRAVARAVERRKAEQVDEVAGLIAFHLEAAEDDLEAAVWHARAGRHVRGTRVFRTAVHHWRSVRHLLAKAEATEETTDLLIEAGIAEIELSLLVGQPREEVEAVLHDTRAAARSAGKVHSEIALLTAYNRYLIGVNAAREAVAALEEAAALASRAGDPNLLVSALTALGLARQSVGSILTAGKAIDDCFAIIKTSGADLDPSVRQSAFAMGTIVLMYAGRLDDAEEALRRAAREIEEYELPLRTYYFASFLADRRGRPEAALKLARTAVEYAEPDGAPFELVLSNNAMGQALWAVGRFREAANHWRRSLEIGRSQGVMMNVQPLQLGGLASTHIGLGELEEARRFAVEAIRIAVDAGVGTMECAARIVMLRVLAAEGAADEMEAEIEQTAILIDRIDGHGYFDPLLSEARAQLAEMRGDRTLRRRELEETARLQEAIGADGHAERIRKLLDD
jgi:adenylate cyclase